MRYLRGGPDSFQGFGRVQPTATRFRFTRVVTLNEPYQGPQTTTGRVERAFRIGVQITVAPASTYRSRILRIHGLAGFSTSSSAAGIADSSRSYRAGNSTGSAQSSHRTANYRPVASA